MKKWVVDAGNTQVAEPSLTTGEFESNIEKMMEREREREGNLKNLQVKFGRDFADAGSGEGGKVSLSDKNGSEDVFGVHAVSVSLHGFDADLGLLREEDVDLVAGVVLLGLVDDEVFTLHVLAVLGFELVLGHVDLEVSHKIPSVPQHLHHRLPDSVQP
ncbi:hypothetical protein DEO72_LG5g132 [Vigna unguiculata]|uniref:Uncharacterized protein n=1 Tax=Vigna unguiculata TaxID=3917 RepID=A0A4D6LW04_VIGUN|nr:hypothetical protein DEO72_LG5g132 [Vigna unguiculata]